MSSLLSGLNVEKQAKATTNANSTQFDLIKASVNKAIHEHLLEEFPEYYVDGTGTDIAKQDSEGNVCGDDRVNGYRLMIPIEETVTLINGSNKKVLASACRVGNPTMYSSGIKNWVAEYVKINGKTHIWNSEQGKFTTTKAK